MSKHVKFISFDKLSVGKHVKSTKKRFTWKFELNNREHQVDLYCSRISGKRKVLLDGDIRYESCALGGIGVTYPFRFERSIIMVVQIGECDFDLRIDNFSLEVLAKKQKSQQAPKNPFEQTHMGQSNVRQSEIYNRPATTRHAECKVLNNDWSRATVIGTGNRFQDPWENVPKTDTWEAQAVPYRQDFRSDITQVFRKSSNMVREMSSPTLPNSKLKLEPMKEETRPSKFVDLLDLEEDKPQPYSASVIVNSKPGNVNTPGTPHRRNNPFMMEDSTYPFEQAPHPTLSIPSKSPQISEFSTSHSSTYAKQDPFSPVSPSSSASTQASADPFSSFKSPSSASPSQYPQPTSMQYSNPVYYTAPPSNFIPGMQFATMTPVPGGVMMGPPVMMPNQMAQMMAMSQFMTNSMMGPSMNSQYFQQPK